MTDHPASWFAIHAFLTDQAATEDLLTRVVAPLSRRLREEGRASGWFFLRYWEGGPHLRVRFRGLDDPARAEVLALLEHEVSARRSPTPMTREAYYGAHSFDGDPLDRDALPWYGDGTVRVFPYQPEYARYGGPDAIGASERLFQISSDLAAAIVAATKDAASKRLSLSFALMAQTAIAFDPAPASIAAFFETYARFWAGYSAETAALGAEARRQPISQSHISALSRRLSTHGTDVASRWGAAAAAFATELGKLGAAGRLRSPLDGGAAQGTRAAMAVQNILGSQLHMLNNRLSVVPAQELVLAHHIANTARVLAGNDDARRTA